ncbi:MAG TPA: hypothetical protein PK156_48905, partial [Polyangium sp.]|nr:hypothetical protein [Polyangium sp.]
MHCSFNLRRLLSPLLVMAMGCAGTSSHTEASRTGAVVDSCATAVNLRARVAPFLASGRLDR